MTSELTTPITAPPNNLVHLSSKWSDDLYGNHDLRWFDLTETAVDPDQAYAIAHHRPILDRHRKTNLIPPFYDHAHYLFPLLFAYDFIQQLGWAEHTSDWDWAVAIQTRDGVWHGDITKTDPDYYDRDTALTNEDPELYEDTFDLNGLTARTMPFSLTESPFDYGAMKVTLPESEFTVALRDIAIVYIDQR